MKLEDLRRIVEHSEKNSIKFVGVSTDIVNKLIKVAEALKKAKAIYDLEMTFETAMLFKKHMDEDVTKILAELERE